MASIGNRASDAPAPSAVRVTIDLGDNLHLMQLCPADAAPFAEAIDTDAAVLKRCIPHIAKLNTAAAVRAHLRRAEPFVAHRAWLDLAIREGEDIAGFIGIYGVDRLDRVAMIGYWVVQSYTGRGIATRALCAVRDFAFGDYELHRLELQIAVDNAPSIAVAERAGFRREGVLRGRFARGASYVDGALYARISGDEPSA
jgi:ribosomal-protein-serine acetyltransferase